MIDKIRPGITAALECGDRTNADKPHVTLLPGGGFFHHADSFALMRGGHLEVCVLGAFQVAVNGDLANWHTGAPDAIPAVGGAMDLTIARQEGEQSLHLHLHPPHLAWAPFAAPQHETPNPLDIGQLGA